MAIPNHSDFSSTSPSHPGDLSHSHSLQRKIILSLAFYYDVVCTFKAHQPPSSLWSSKENSVLPCTRLAPICSSLHTIPQSFQGALPLLYLHRLSFQLCSRPQGPPQYHPILAHHSSDLVTSFPALEIQALQQTGRQALHSFSPLS